MLTPNEIKDRLKIIDARSRIQLSTSYAEVTRKRLLLDLYTLVLKEIAGGSIDPKSLAIAVLGNYFQKK